jgi:hypothetical protein
MSLWLQDSNFCYNLLQLGGGRHEIWLHIYERPLRLPFTGEKQTNEFNFYLKYYCCAKNNQANRSSAYMYTHGANDEFLITLCAMR